MGVHLERGEQGYTWGGGAGVYLGRGDTLGWGSGVYTQAASIELEGVKLSKRERSP